MNFIQIILGAAKSVKVSGAILVAICTHESGLNNIAIQDRGSFTYGICQVKYETASMLGYEGSPEGLMDPKINAIYAATYLRYQHNRYGNWCKAIAAYNAGRYNESKILPGKPRNIKYVRNVQMKLNKSLKKITSCDINQEEVEDIAKNNGDRL
jgi:soluble lytic murein transglycosylase-like protein